MLEPMLVDEIIRGFEDSDALIARIRSQEGPSELHVVKQLWLMFEVKQVQVVEAILQILKQNTPAREQMSRTYLSKFPEEALENHFVASMLLVGQRLLMLDDDLLFLSDLFPMVWGMLVYLVDIKLILQQQRHNLPDLMALELILAMYLFQEDLYKFEYKVLSAIYYEKDGMQLEEQQIVAVLFCEAVARALRNGYLTHEMLDSSEPSLMLTIPRLGIVCGMLFYPGSPLNLSFPGTLPSIFMPYSVTLRQIQYLLSFLTSEELVMLERLLVMTDSEDLHSPMARLSASPRALPPHPSGQQSSCWELGIPAMLPAHSSGIHSLLHQLFLSISEVVAKMQSDSATELSDILKMVFRMMAPMAEEELYSFGQDRPASTCQGCQALFLLFRLKRYCQVCNKAFCDECISYRIPCGQNSHLKVCHLCYFSYLYSVGL